MGPFRTAPLALLLIAAPAAAEPGDVPGSADHPAVSRYPGVDHQMAG